MSQYKLEIVSADVSSPIASTGMRCDLVFGYPIPINIDPHWFLILQARGPQSAVEHHSEDAVWIEIAGNRIKPGRPASLTKIHAVVHKRRAEMMGDIHLV